MSWWHSFFFLIKWKFFSNSIWNIHGPFLIIWIFDITLSGMGSSAWNEIPACRTAAFFPCRSAVRRCSRRGRSLSIARSCTIRRHSRGCWCIRVFCPVICHLVCRCCSIRLALWSRIRVILSLATRLSAISTSWYLLCPGFLPIHRCLLAA